MTSTICRGQQRPGAIRGKVQGVGSCHFITVLLHMRRNESCMYAVTKFCDVLVREMLPPAAPPPLAGASAGLRARGITMKPPAPAGAYRSVLPHTCGHHGACGAPLGPRDHTAAAGGGHGNLEGKAAGCTHDVT
jgi:hypothetical protein